MAQFATPNIRTVALVGHGGAWQNRAHFFAVAAQVMRHILVDRARRRRAGKRGGEWMRITLDDAVAGAAFRDAELDLIELDQALSELAALDPGKARLVELRFFGGLSVEEAAEVMGVSRTTANREWQTAKASSAPDGPWTRTVSPSFWRSAARISLPTSKPG